MKPFRFSFAAFCKPAAPVRRRHPTTRPTAKPPTDPITLGDQPDEPDGLAGCGWFDSSWCLRSGLQITEIDTVDAVLPVSWWLAWQTGPQRGPGLALAADSAAR